MHARVQGTCISQEATRKLQLIQENPSLQNNYILLENVHMHDLQSIWKYTKKNSLGQIYTPILASKIAYAFGSNGEITIEEMNPGIRMWGHTLQKYKIKWKEIR